MEVTEPGNTRKGTRVTFSKRSPKKKTAHKHCAGQPISRTSVGERKGGTQGTGQETGGKQIRVGIGVGERRNLGERKKTNRTKGLGAARQREGERKEIVRNEQERELWMQSGLDRLGNRFREEGGGREREKKGAREKSTGEGKL